MSFCKVKSCCGICSVKTGTQIIGVIGAIFSLIAVIGSVMFLLLFNGELNKEDTVINFGKGSVVEAFLVSPVYEKLSTIAAVSSMMFFIFNILLIIGVAQSKPKLLVPWLMYEGICTFVSVVLLVFFTLDCFVSLPIAYGFSTLLYTITYFCACWYCISVVFNYFQQLVENPNDIVRV